MKKKSGSETPSGDGADIDRRTILKRAALVVGAGAAIPSCISTENEPSTSPSYGSENSSVIAREGAAVVEIESGKIAGAIIRGIYSFKGIPCRCADDHRHDIERVRDRYERSGFQTHDRG